MHISKVFMTVLFATLVLLATGTLANDEVYRWVDENGVVHFGDRPDGQIEAELVDIQVSKGSEPDTSPALDSADPGQPSEPEPSLAQQRRDERAAKRLEAAEQEAGLAQPCETARQRVASLEPSPKVLVQNEDGTVYRLDDEKRLEVLADAKAFIAKNCVN